MAEDGGLQVQTAPENQAAWASNAKASMSNANALTMDLLTHLKEKEFSEHAIPKAAFAKAMYRDRGPRAQESLDNLLGTSREAVYLMDATISQAKECLHQLQHEKHSKWAALKVCEWRYELRERRPLQELFKDHVTEALEKEREVLNVGRATMVEHINEARIRIEECEFVRMKLIRNVRHMVLLGTTDCPAAGQPPQSGLQSPHGTSSPSNAAPDGEAPPPPAQSLPQTPAQLARRAPQLSALIEQMVFKATQAMQKSGAECARASERVMASLAKRTEDNDKVKKDMEEQLEQTKTAIATAEKSMRMMCKRMEIAQPGSSANPGPKYEAAAAALEKLRAAKHDLAEDVHRKIISMKIDEACRKVTPDRTSVPIDKVPAVSVQSPSVQNAGRMRRVASSPGNIAADVDSAASTASTMRPASPAGVSKPLKAAAAASIIS